MQKSQVETVKYLSDDEWNRFEAAIKAKSNKRARVRDLCLFQLMVDYGLRLGECALILLDDLNWETAKIIIHRLKRKNFSDSYPMSAGTMKLIRAWLVERKKLKLEKFNKHLFIAQQSGVENPLSEEMIYYAFKKYAQVAGIPAAHPHQLRHTCAIRLVRRGFTALDVKRWLGHASLSSTEIYTILAGPEKEKKDREMLEALATF